MKLLIYSLNFFFKHLSGASVDELQLKAKYLDD